jgi:hypothetical protein
MTATAQYTPAIAKKNHAASEPRKIHPKAVHARAPADQPIHGGNSAQK